MSLKRIAQSPQARFEWWVQTKFNVLPTDSRYLDLTEEQLDLLYEHYQLDHPEKKPAYTDEDYDKEEFSEEPTNEQTNDKSRLPIQDHEHYEDPEFDKEWDAEDEDDEVSNSNNVGKNPSENDFEMLGEHSESDIKDRIDLDDTDEWEEV